jgi:hypothetical protein
MHSLWLVGCFVWIICQRMVLFLLDFVLSVHLQFTDLDYPSFKGYGIYVWQIFICRNQSYALSSLMTYYYVIERSTRQVSLGIMHFFIIIPSVNIMLLNMKSSISIKVWLPSMTNVFLGRRRLTSQIWINIIFICRIVLLRCYVNVVVIQSESKRGNQTKRRQRMTFNLWLDNNKLML